MLVQDAVSQAQQKFWHWLSAARSDLLGPCLKFGSRPLSDSSACHPAYTCLGADSCPMVKSTSYREESRATFRRNSSSVPGDRIAVQLPNLMQYPMWSWSRLGNLGLVIVNTNPMYTVRELVHQFNDSGVKAVVVLDQFYQTLMSRASRHSNRACHCDAPRGPSACSLEI